MGLLDFLSALQPTPPEEQDPLASAAELLREPAPPPPRGLAAGAQQLFEPAPPPPAAPRQRFTPALPEVPELAPAPAPPPRKPGAKITRDQVLGEQDTGLAQEEAGIRQEAGVKASRADWLADQQLRALMDQQEAAERLGEAREGIRQQTSDRMARINQEIETLGAQKPDPKRYFKEQGTLGNVAQFIGVLLGGYSAAKTGKNLALEFIEREVERDVQAQARDFQQKLATLQERKGAAKDELASNLDALEFKVSRQVDANNRVMQMIASAASRFEGPEVQARAEQAIGQLRQKNAALLEGIRSTSVREAQEGARIGLQRRGVELAEKEFEESKRRFDIDTVMKMKQLEQAGNAEGAKKLAEERSRAVFAVTDPATGQAVTAPSPKVAEELNKKVGKATTTVGMLDRLAEIRDKIGGGGIGVLPADERKEAESIVRMVWYDLSILQEQGVVREGEVPTYNAMVGDPTAWRDTLPKLMAVRNRIVSDVNNSIESQTGAKLGEARWNPQTRAEQGVVAGGAGGERGAGLIDKRAPSGRAAPRGLPPASAAPSLDEDNWATVANAYFNKGGR